MKESRKKLTFIALKFIFMAGIIFQINGVSANSVDGSWSYVKQDRFFSERKTEIMLSLPFVQALQGKFAISPSCLVDLGVNRYALSMVFKNLIERAGEVEKIFDYIYKNFGIDLRSKAVESYKVERIDCAKNLENLIVDGNKMIAISSDNTIYGFVRSPRSANDGVSKCEKLLKISPFPFSPGNFSMLCVGLIPRINGVPQDAKKCGPLYFPYVARQNDGRTMSNIVGHHHYAEGRPGQSFFDDYDDPFANGLHPMYMILPPLKDVQLLRIEDDEGSIEDREISGGAYLAIKDGVVVDQLDEGCDMGADYVCSHRDRADAFRLLESGKFKKIR
jgi:hypothetical protein